MAATTRQVLLLLCAAVALGPSCATRDQHASQSVALTAPARSQAQTPFFDARSQTAEYVGPGREVPPPGKIAAIKIGWFGPTDPDDPETGQMWLAATLAIDDANRASGYKGLPFRLIPSWSDNPWGTGVRGVTRLIYEHDVWAIVGAPDGPSAHLVEQITAKARLPFVNPVSTDKTTNLANVPWIFSCAPGDHLLAPAVAQALASHVEKGDIAIVSCTDHDSRMFTTEFLAALERTKVFPTLHLQFRRNSSDFGSQIEHVHTARPSAVVLIAPVMEAARFLIAMRSEGLTMPVFGGPAMGRRLFAATAGPSAEGVMFPLLWHPSTAGERATAFARCFQERFGLEPDYTAAHTYDAMTLLVAAINKAGLNRARIRDAVRELSPWHGVTGAVNWDPTGHNNRAVRVGTIRNGQVDVMQPP